MGKRIKAERGEGEEKGTENENDYKNVIAKRIYESHTASMNGSNGYKNQQQIDILAELQEQIDSYADDPENHGGYVKFLYFF